MPRLARGGVSFHLGDSGWASFAWLRDDRRDGLGRPLDEWGEHVLAIRLRGSLFGFLEEDGTVGRFEAITPLEEVLGFVPVRHLPNRRGRRCRGVGRGPHFGGQRTEEGR